MQTSSGLPNIQNLAPIGQKRRDCFLIGQRKESCACIGQLLGGESRIVIGGWCAGWFGVRQHPPIP